LGSIVSIHVGFLIGKVGLGRALEERRGEERRGEERRVGEGDNSIRTAIMLDGNSCEGKGD
jgi:hypothetical protein